MNFKFRRFLSLSVSFILGAFFCLIGSIGLILPWSPALQNSLSHLIFNQTLILSLFGLGGIFIGVSLVINAIFNTGGRYAYIKILGNTVAVDENLIEQYLQAYWKKKFPNQQILFYFSIKKKSIQIVADLPYVSETEQDKFLEKIQDDFTELFGDVLGYPNEIHFVAHFQKEVAPIKH